MRENMKHAARLKAVRALNPLPDECGRRSLVRMRRALWILGKLMMSWMRIFGGNRIFFGRYTSATKVTGGSNIPDSMKKKMRKSAFG